MRAKFLTVPHDLQAVHNFAPEPTVIIDDVESRFEDGLFASKLAEVLGHHLVLLLNTVEGTVCSTAQPLLRFCFWPDALLAIAVCRKVPFIHPQ